MLSRRLMRRLRERCTMPIDDFRSLGDCVDTPDGPLIHVDRGADVLAVAHLDYVLWSPPSIRNGIIRCPQLDDRLGVWAILDLLPAMGVTVDVLLTDSEERGRSTAQYFEPDRQYNWLLELDRAGTDVVLYDYESLDNRALLDDWTIGNGSFTDICSMEHLGVTGFNFGIGYHDQHTEDCYAFIADAVGQVCRVSRFWREHHEHWIPAPTDSEDAWWDDACVCVDCGELVAPTDADESFAQWGWILCDDCIEASIFR